MHVGLIGFEYQVFSSVEELLETYFTYTDWAEALVKQGVQVTVMYRYNESIQFERNCVKYHLINDGKFFNPGRFGSCKLFIKKVNEIVKENDIDVIQLSNLEGIVNNMLVSKIINTIPVLIQDHGSVLSKSNFIKNWLFKHLLRFSFKNVSGLIFAAKGQETEWVANKVIPDNKCFFVMENSSHFSYSDRSVSRKTSLMNGDPVFLWVGNLDQNKDPFTAIKAFHAIAKNYPTAKLYMVFRYGVLKGEVENLIKELSLEEKVILLGSKKRNELELYYNSADYIIAASYKEGSGYSVIEAMSCGAIPILSNIPSFLSLTNHGDIGAVFEVGNVDSLVEKTLQLMQSAINLEREKTLEHFSERISFQALASDAIDVYQELIQIQVIN